MNTHDIAVFVTASTVGTLVVTSQHLRISPMQASRQLAALEKDLGVRLLHRSSRSVSLTPEGETFLPLARTILSAEQMAQNALSWAAKRCGAGSG